MPLILPSAALLAVLARPADAPGQAAAPAADDGRQKTDPGKPKQPKQPKQPKEDTPRFRLGDDHPEIDFGKGSRLEFRARFAADRSDSEASTADPAEASTIDLGKKRIGVAGEIKNAFEFQIEAELDDDDPWRDVYGEFKSFGFARVRGGKFKVPFSLDENTGASRLDFMFRSLAATHLAPGRDLGVMVHGTGRQRKAALRSRRLRARRQECPDQQSGQGVRRPDAPRYASRSNRCAIRRTRSAICRSALPTPPARCPKVSRGCAARP